MTGPTASAPTQELERELRWLEDETQILVALRAPIQKPEPREELAHLRLRHAWRIARAKAQLNNWIDQASPLAALEERSYLDGEPDTNFWSTISFKPRALHYPTQEDLEAEVDPNHDLRPITTSWGKYATNPELRAALVRQAIMPAPGQQWYDEYPDRWLEATTLVAERLHLNDPPRVEDPHTGTLLDTNKPDAADAVQELLTIPESWPSPQEILHYEDDIIDMVVSLLVQRGQQQTNKFLTTCFVLTKPEVKEVISMARTRSQDLTMADVEEKRALMELMLEDLAQRCKKSHDLRAELGVYKAMAVVQGIARAEVEDDGEMFARIVKSAPKTIQTSAVVKQLVPQTSDRLEQIDGGD